jgi:5-carboxymethyl-2-hydroxymuconate isomerase
MPHIIVECSRNIAAAPDVPELLQSLHRTMTAQEGVDEVKVKTRLLSLSHSIVGKSAPEEGAMVHVTLLLLEGRAPEVKKAYGAALHKALSEHLKSRYSEASLTVEIRDMVRETYFQ